MKFLFTESTDGAVVAVEHEKRPPEMVERIATRLIIGATVVAVVYMTGMLGLLTIAGFVFMGAALWQATRI